MTLKSLTYLVLAVVGFAYIAFGNLPTPKTCESVLKEAHHVQ